MTVYNAVVPIDITVKLSDEDVEYSLTQSNVHYELLQAILRGELATTARQVRRRIKNLREFTIRQGTELHDLRTMRDESGRRLGYIRTMAIEDAQRLLDSIVGEGRFIIYRNAQTLHVKPVRPLDQRVMQYKWGDPSIGRYDGGGLGDNRAETNDIASLVIDMVGYMNRRGEWARQMMRAAGLLGTYEDTRTPKKPVRSGGGDFQAFYNKRPRTPQYNDVFALMPLLSRGTVSSRRWGIEVEAVDIDGIRTPEHWDLRDDGSLRSVMLGGEEHDEECTFFDYHDADDCDCGVGYGGDYSTTGEFTSPILSSFHSRGLEYLTGELSERQSNDSAGVHVHVEASDLTPTQAARVAIIYGYLEPLFQHEYQRSTREYCKPHTASNLVDIMRSVREAQRRGSSVASLGYFTDRYTAVNLNALSAHSTIEFRAMGDRYEYGTLIKWAYFCREMVNVARANVPQRVWASITDFRGIIEMFAKYGKETPTPEWVETEARTTPTLETVEIDLPVLSTTRDVFEDYTAVEPAFARIGW